MRKLLVVTVAIISVAQPAFATKPVANRVIPAGCEFKENVTVGISFNMNASSMQEAKSKFDETMGRIAQYAADQKIEKLDPQSMNYNIYAQNNGSDKNYQVTGNVQYQMTSSDVAFKFADFLEKQKMNVNINANSYRQGNCNQ